MSVTVEQLIEAGAHFGHLTRRWNPQMRPFIYGQRNGIHIIDLRKTQLLIEVAAQAAGDVVSKGEKFLFVGTKKQAKLIMPKEAEACGAYYVSERWLGGMLTNFQTVRKSIRRLEHIEKMESDGTFEKLRKKERLILSREKEKLNKVFSGIRHMTRLPGALFVVDIKKEHIAIQEAHKLGIPVFAIVDTNCDPTTVDYPIPANDDSIRTIELVTRALGESLLQGREIAKVRAAENASAPDREAKEADGEDRPRRRMRKRRDAAEGEAQSESAE